MNKTITRREFGAGASLFLAGTLSVVSTAQSADAAAGAQLLVLYKTPKDPAAFDAYYAATHIALAKKIPGLKSYVVSSGTVAAPAGASGVHLVAILGFDSMADLQAGLGSPEGQAAAGDLANFATGGADLYMFDSKDA